MTGTRDGIVAGYDGSPGAEEALRWAVQEAWERGTVLTVCFAWSPEYLALLGVASVCDLAERKAEEILAQGARYARDALGPETVRPVLARGLAAGALCERSRTAEMVVTGARGHGGIADQPLGSVAWQVAMHGHGPVVVVRRQWHLAGRTRGPVTVGLDQSPTSHAVAAFAFREAQLRKVPLLAVCALADGPSLLGGAREMEEDFSRAMTRLEKEHPDVTVLRQVEQGSPRDALLAAAREAQLLVVGRRGRGGVRGMSLGSVAQALLHYAPCPVAVIKPPAGADHGKVASSS
ncbi:MAG TPA: universal stress protein [Trebonia sp.]|jgi:nucleotide-binding universal stress UspA family protein